VTYQEILTHDLSPREREVLLWCARGKTYTEIALILEISFGSVKSHLDHCRYKLGASTLASATALAVAYKIFDVEDLRGRV
jgi:DNA-binding CsgD family transcriptional regulator